MASKGLFIHVYCSYLMQACLLEYLIKSKILVIQRILSTYFVYKESKSEIAQSYLTLCQPVTVAYWASPFRLGKNTEAVAISFLRIFPTQGSNLGLRIVGRGFTVRTTRQVIVYTIWLIWPNCKSIT